MNTRHFLIIVTTLSATACQTTYSPPAKGVAFATLVIEKGYESGTGKNNVQQFDIVPDTQVCKSEKIASLTWINSNQVSKSIPAGNPINIMATNLNLTTTGGYWNGVAYIANTKRVPCKSMIYFTPQIGKKYNSKFLVTKAGLCTLEFIDSETGGTPAGAKIEDNYSCEKQ